MKVLLSWINDYVNTSNIELKTLVKGLTDAGFEVEEVIDKSKGLDHVVVANINRNILLADMPRFVAKMKPAAKLILSGFYSDDVESLKQKACSLGLALEDMVTDGDWTMLVFG